MDFPQIIEKTDKLATFDCGCQLEIKNGLPIIDYHNINVKCPKIWELLSTGKTLGIFQLENKGLGGHWAKAMQPSNIPEIAQLISIIRPGCLNVKFEDGKSATHHFVQRKLGHEKAEPIHPVVENVLKDTYQIILYQEEAIQIAKEVAGFSLVEAETLRKSIGHKDAELLSSLKTKFIDGCINHSKLNKEIGELLFDTIEKSNRYNFNLCSHKDTKIKRPDSSDIPENLTIEQLYRIKHDSKYAEQIGCLNLNRRFNEKGDFGYGFSMKIEGESITKNLIRSITYQGKQQCYRVELVGGNTIKVTKNHKFPTSDREWGYDGKRTTEELEAMWEYDDEINKELYVCVKDGTGYITKTQEIYGIFEDEVSDVYDVEMDAPYHNFAVESGIITCNSHATGYAITSLWCSFAKSHLPLRFYCASLINAKHKSAKNPLLEVKDLVIEGKHFGLKFAPPSIIHSKEDFSIKNGIIYFGLQNILGIGQSQANTILNQVEKLQKELNLTVDKICWLDYLIRLFDSISITSSHNMILAGCFDSLGISRKKMDYELKTWKKLTERERDWVRQNFSLSNQSLISLLGQLLNAPVGRRKGVSSEKRKKTLESLLLTLKTPPYSLEDTLQNIVKWENSLLGVCITGNALLCNEQVNIDTTCKNILDGKNGICTIGVELTKVKQHKVKNGKSKGKPMMFLDVDDESGSLNIVCFPDQFERFNDLLYQGNTVAIIGERGDGDSFIAKRVIQI